MSWETSDRKAHLPANWASLRRSILERDGHQCTWLDDLQVRCPQTATDVDHMGDRDDHRPEMLRSLCGWHHSKVTAKQGNNARVRLTQRRPTEAHPGLT